MIKFIRNLLMTTPVLDGEKKVKNAITFLAFEHERLTQKLLSVNILHKYLALLDAASLEKIGSPALGLPHREKGRIFTDPYRRREAPKDCFVLIPQKGEYMVKATGEPDLSCFSSLEIDEMKKLVEVNADHLAKALHRRLSSFDTDDTKTFDEVVIDLLEDDNREEARAEIKNPVTDVSERRFLTHREVSAMTGLNLLIEKYQTRINELETQMAEIKHKLEIITATSRLLEEEGLLLENE